jgi:hypothetical protein
MYVHILPLTIRITKIILTSEFQQILHIHFGGCTISPMPVRQAFIIKKKKKKKKTNIRNPSESNT